MSEAESIVDYAIHVIIDADLRTQYAEKSAAHWHRRYRRLGWLSVLLVIAAAIMGFAAGYFARGGA